MVVVDGEQRSLEGERRFALVVASADYEDETLRRLVAPPRDAEALARVLEDPGIGNFEVTTLTNAHSFTVLEKLETFFDRRRRDDLLLVYFSGHGIKNESGQLYFATTNTRHDRLRSSAVPAAFLHDVMDQCRSRRQVLVLDCCHSGAFIRGMTPKTGGRVGLAERFEGRGRIVLTASDAVQYAFEGDDLTGEGARSVFTRSLVEGLRTGAADLDGDGYVSLDELYDYLDEQIRHVQTQQQPHMWAFDVQGEICVAHSPAGLLAVADGAPPAVPEPAEPESPVGVKAVGAPTGAPEDAPGEAPQDAPEDASPKPVVGQFSGRPSALNRPSVWALAMVGMTLAVLALAVLNRAPTGDVAGDGEDVPGELLGGGLLAAEAVRGGQRDIVILRPDGALVRELTNGRGDNLAPAWSWDRTRVAFSSNRDGPYALYVADVTTGEVRKVTDGGGGPSEGLFGDFAPAWRPDDAVLTFPRRLQGGGFDLHEVDLETGAVSQLTSGQGAEQRPGWSPSGDLLLFHSNRDGDFDLYGLRPGAAEWERFTDDDANNRHPIMSADGAFIVFDSDRANPRDVFVMPADGGPARNLTNGTPTESQKPSFSPDGSQIVFESIQDERSRIYRMRRDGDGLTLLTGDLERADPDW